jgi:signal transduction histidine kinase/CheY-like chemotaxis protein
VKRTTVSERALVLAPRGRDATIAVAMLDEAGISAEACASLSDLIRQLDQGAGFVVVTEEALATADLAPLAAWLTDQEEWSDLPFVLLTSHGGGLERNPAARRYLDVLGNVTFLERPFHPTTLVSLARSALRVRRRQYEARGRLETLREGETRLQAAVEAEQRANETLEARVAERTEELMQAHEALRQSQKMEAMGQLTGGVAHDFNNLLTPIVAVLDRLQRRGGGDEREQRLIAGAAQSAERAKTLVQRLLAFARRQPLQTTAVDVAELVTGMADLVSSTIGPQIRVVVDTPPNLPPAKADANQLEMALLNLSVNARDAMPDGGTLRITATAETIQGRNNAGLKPGAYIRLSVADTGIGMDEATLARAVEPFFSTKGVGKGTGLGLSMVHGLVSQLGGAMTINSQPGLGTNVEIWLPQSEGEAGLATPRPDVEPEPSARGRVLLVDDEELVRLSTSDMLSELGYGVVEAASAEEALALLSTGVDPHLLVTDHLMPGMSGTDLARQIVAERPEITVLLVSGYAESTGIEPDLPRLTKPFRKDELAAALAKLGALTS